MAEDAPPLETWTVATFNVVVFGLVLVLAGHANGILTDALPSLGTLPGLGVFGYLWLLVYGTTRWALAEGGLDRSTEGELVSLLARGGVAGAFAGLGFVVGIVLAGSAVGVLTGRIEPVQIALVSLFGGTASTIVGCLVGVVFVLVDVSLYRTTALLTP